MTLINSEDLDFPQFQELCLGKFLIECWTYSPWKDYKLEEVQALAITLGAESPIFYKSGKTFTLMSSRFVNIQSELERAIFGVKEPVKDSKGVIAFRGLKVKNNLLPQGLNVSYFTKESQ